MKKLICALAVLVLMLAAPALARVDITCSQTDDGEVTVSFVATSEPNRVRGFALNIGADNGAKITSVTEIDQDDYWVHPGDINIVGGAVDSNGSAVGDAGQYVGTWQGPPDSNGVTIEMGSLFWPVTPASPNAPAKSGDLFKLTVDKSCTVTIKVNPIRGGVVMENPDEVVDVNLPSSCEVEAGCACLLDVTTSNTGWDFGLNKFDPNLLNGQNNIVNMADLMTCVNYIKTEGGFSRSPIYPVILECLDVTTSNTGWDFGLNKFDPNLLNGSNNIVNMADLMAMVNYIKTEGGFTRPCLVIP